MRKGHSMRDQRTIESEIDTARGDLEASLSELKDVVQDKLDFKKRAHDLMDRGRHEASELYARAKTGVRDRPGTAVVTLLALIGLTTLAILAARNKRRRELEPFELLRKQICRSL